MKDIQFLHSWNHALELAKELGLNLGHSTDQFIVSLVDDPLFYSQSITSVNCFLAGYSTKAKRS